MDVRTIGEISRAQAIEAVHARRSCRTYTGEALETALSETLARICRLGSDASATLGPIVEGLPENVGTYGVIRRAACFIPLVCNPDDPKAVMEVAYRAEQAVLWLTCRGAGTCWLGATFNFKDLQAEAGRKTVAAIAVGMPAQREHLLSRLSGRLAGSRTRRPFDELFAISSGSDYRSALELVRLAPSALNKQPWRAVETAEGLHFFCAGSSLMNHLDMGIAFCHFSLDAPAGRWAREERYATLRKERYVASWLRL